MRTLLVAMGLVAIALVVLGVVVEALTWLVVAGMLIALAAFVIGAVKGRQMLRRRAPTGTPGR